MANVSLHKRHSQQATSTSCHLQCGVWQCTEIDSTKKVCKKLQGLAAGSAFWCKNVGNERGEVLISVLMESEGLEGLHPMVTGLIEVTLSCVQ